LHAEDAQQHALNDGDLIKVTSKISSLSIPVKITENIKTGVVSIPHGWGHVFADTKINIAKEHPGVNINRLMDEGEIDELSGNAVLAGVAINIEKL
jgi:anaerobic selenocysteine-containing dehydrogenase